MINMDPKLPNSAFVVNSREEMAHYLYSHPKAYGLTTPDGRLLVVLNDLETGQQAEGGMTGQHHKERK